MEIRPTTGCMEGGAASEWAGKEGPRQERAAQERNAPPPGLLTESPFRSLDHAKEAWIARATGGLSPAALALAFSDWFIHLLAAPGKQLELASLAVRQARQFAEAACGAAPLESAGSHDDRFKAAAWQASPFRLWQQAFELTDQWWCAATHGTPGATHHHEDVVSFAARQWLDVISPGNFALTNPEVLQRTAQTFGANLVQGACNAVEILDLSPHNSLVRYLVDRGHTVFCISWRNPDESDRDLGFEDYRELGIMAALDAMSNFMPDRKIHAAGYCLGGTLLAIAAAAMASRHDEQLASVTLFAAQTDFTEPGELQLFIDDSQVYFLESMMWERGYLGGAQMGGSFQLLRSNDLVWSHAVHGYLLGERKPMTDLAAWNADRTRMPYRMHSQYLRHLFLENDLACGRYEVEGRPVSLRNIRVPMFVVGTERDHIAPWRSVYKIHHLADTDITFVLTSGGHNAGIVSEPGQGHRHFRIKSTAHAELNIGPDEWMNAAELREGSWWPAWEVWLDEHSCAQRVAPPHMEGHSIMAAPGAYVFQK